MLSNLSLQNQWIEFDCSRFEIRRCDFDQSATKSDALPSFACHSAFYVIQLTLPALSLYLAFIQSD